MSEGLNQGVNRTGLPPQAGENPVPASFGFQWPQVVLDLSQKQTPRHRFSAGSLLGW